MLGPVANIRRLARGNANTLSLSLDERLIKHHVQGDDEKKIVEILDVYNKDVGTSTKTSD